MNNIISDLTTSLKKQKSEVRKTKKVIHTLKRIQKTIKNSEDKNIKGKIVLLKTSKSDFNETLKNSMGFGFQDLKEHYRKTFLDMMTNGYNLHVEPISINEQKIEISVIL